MLEYLRIRDLALIEDMELDFAPGMNVLTGETGAGKSFILKALNFLMGDKLTGDMVRPGSEKATVEALFALDDGDVILRRELAAETGRSRIFLNDRLTSQDTVRDMRAALILHTSQHGQQKLLQPVFQARLLDGYMNQPDLLEQRDGLVRELRELTARREALLERSRNLEDKRDMLEFQQREIDKVAPEPGEEDELESRRVELRDAAVLREGFDNALQLLRGDDGPGLAVLLGALEEQLHQLSRIDATFSADATQMRDLRANLGDLERRLRRRPHVTPEDDLEAIEARLFQLAQLKRKLRRSLDDIVRMRDEIAENLSFLDACGLDLKKLDRDEADLRERLATLLGTLNPARRSAADALCRELEAELAGLGFSEHVRVDFEFTPHELCPGCAEDRARLLWVPNPGQTPQPLDRIASGGELSRFLLAVVGLMSRDEAATLIFDEVDAGVGGLTLNRVADRLEMLATRRQTLVITHWPQLAARAARHFQIRKEVNGQETFTLCRRLDGAEIREELARMAGGGAQGEAVARGLATGTAS